MIVRWCIINITKHKNTPVRSFTSTSGNLTLYVCIIIPFISLLPSGNISQRERRWTLSNQSTLYLKSCSPFFYHFLSHRFAFLSTLGLFVKQTNAIIVAIIIIIIVISITVDIFNFFICFWQTLKMKIAIKKNCPEMKKWYTYMYYKGSTLSIVKSFFISPVQKVNDVNRQTIM